MPYTVTPQGEDPILLVEVSDPFDFRRDPHGIRSGIYDIIGDAAKPFIIIYDMRKLSITFADIVIGLTDTMYTPDDTKEILQRYSKVLIVGVGPLITLAIDSLNRFAELRVAAKIFATLEEALEYARSQVANSQP